MNPTHIIVNSDPTQVAPGTTVREFLGTHLGKQLNADGTAADGSKLGLALAIDGMVVPRSVWAHRELHSGNRIDIVSAAQGG